MWTGSSWRTRSSNQTRDYVFPWKETSESQTTRSSPVEEIEIHPLLRFTVIRFALKKTTDVLEITSWHFKKSKRYITRYKYATKDTQDTQITIESLLPIESSTKEYLPRWLLANILVDKYVDHLPLYRQKQRLKERSKSSFFNHEGWAAQSLLML
jgi:hypothetical protein